MKDEAKLLFGLIVLAPLVSRAAMADEGAPPVHVAPSPDAVVIDAHVNALGPLQFGLAPTIEVGRGHWAGLAYFRWLNSGLLARSLLPSRDHEELVFSYGVGAGPRYYFGQGLRGFNLGPTLEYLHVVVETDQEREAYVSSWLVPQLALGYRWKFGRFLLGLGASGGYALSLSARTEDLSGGADPIGFYADDTSRPFANANADIGFYFF